VTNTSSTGATNTITTSVSTPSGVTVTQNITYVNGSQQFTHQWTITNSGGTTYTAVALRYGGDTYYHDADEAVGFYNSSTGLLYCTDPNYTGFMGMEAASSTPASSYYEDAYGSVWSALQSTTIGLPDTVNPTNIDNGMGLEWDHGSFAPYSTINFTASEIWDNPSAVTVTAPATQEITLNVPTALTFTVTNTETGSDTFSLQALPTTGLTVQSVSPAGPITLAANGSQNVTVTVTATGASGQYQPTLSLVATSTQTPANTSQGAVLLNMTAALVVPPANITVPTGGTATLTFIVTNEETVSDTFSLDAESTSTDITIQTINGQVPTTEDNNPSAKFRTMAAGPIELGQAITLAGGQSISIPVQVSVAGPVGEMDDVVFAAASTVNYLGSSGAVGYVGVTIGAAGGTTTGSGTGGPAPVLPHVGVPVSSPGHTVYYPVCPSTTAGIQNLLDVIAGAGRDAVGYAWDAGAQSYTKLPTQPAGGLLPTSGAFVAAAVGLSFNFDGTLPQAPVSITLQPGWNMVGVPPIDLGGGSTLTSFPFPGDFTLLVGGSPVSDIPTFVNTLGTVGSLTVATAEPYFYDGSSYSQVATLTAGPAYWIKNNNASQSVVLQISTSGAVLSAKHLNAATASPGSATTTYTDRGQPPAVPTGFAATAAQGGCGVAGGLSVIGLLAVLGRRRQLRRSANG
jgi:hypothetical protein